MKHRHMKKAQEAMAGVVSNPHAITLCAEALARQEREIAAKLRARDKWYTGELKTDAIADAIEQGDFWA